MSAPRAPRTSAWALSPLLALLLGLLVPLPAGGEGEASPQAWGAAMAAPAARWLERGGARAGGQIAFAEPERANWHYVPRRRRGVAFARMSPPEREAALALLRAGLSGPGAAQAEGVMALESVLARLEGNRSRDPLEYALTVFGTPGRAPWGWRLEGHHLSLNLTVATPEQVAVTPCFVGSNPARVPFGPTAGSRLQAREIDLGFALARSLDEAQWRAALLQARTPGDVITGPGRALSLAAPRGLAASALTALQQERLLELVAVYVERAPAAFARPYLEQVRRDLATTRLAWAGARAPGAPCYYRVHGPRVLIELDNTQNQANHVHSLWRDPTNDFGRGDLERDDLARHVAGPGHAHLIGR